MSDTAEMIEMVKNDPKIERYLRGFTFTAPYENHKPEVKVAIALAKTVGLYPGEFVECPECRGEGVRGVHMCSACQGEGSLPKRWTDLDGVNWTLSGYEAAHGTAVYYTHVAWVQPMDAVDVPNAYRKA